MDAIARLIDEGGSHYAAVVNAAKIVAATKDNELKRALLEADLVTADGMSVVWASRLLGQPLKERVTGIELFQRLIHLASERGWAVYFLGRATNRCGESSRDSRASIRRCAWPDITTATSTSRNQNPLLQQSAKLE